MYETFEINLQHIGIYLVEVLVSTLKFKPESIAVADVLVESENGRDDGANREDLIYPHHQRSESLELDEVAEIDDDVFRHLSNKDRSPSSTRV